MEKNKDNKVHNIFITFVIAALCILMLFILNVSFSRLSAYGNNIGRNDMALTVISVILIVSIYLLRKRGVSNKKLIIITILVGFVLRVIYAFTINSIPISDFAIMYETAEDVLNGDFSNLWGTGYIARFPHITIPVMYFALIRYIFTEPLLAIKFFNVIASTINIGIVYLIIEELFNDTWKAQIGAIITALFPPLILYTAIFTTENLAIPLYLLAIYLFIKATKSEKKIKLFFIAALCLSFGNLFRMVGQIILVAFVLYIIVSYKQSLRKSLL